MAKQIYVNLPVKDLRRSKEFYKNLGFTFEPKYTDDNAACVVVDDNIFVMLLAEKFFATFTGKAIADASASTEVLVCVSCESREEVDQMVAKAIVAGGEVPREPVEQGSLYGHGFEDLDGHIWELIHVRPAKAR